MSQWITERGRALEPFAQPTQMECWIASYRMVLQASGLAFDLNTIEKKLESGGFKQAKECRARGLTDDELTQAGGALKMGKTTTKEIATYQGLRNMLMMCGPLWVAGMFEMSDKDGVKRKYKHVIVVVGVDEEHESICWVNPWKWNGYDEPTKGWIGWKWFYDAISNTFNMEASLQFSTPATAVALSLQ